MPDPGYILALDQGTTSSRAILFDHGCTIRGIAQREFRQIFPQPGWVEHDPEEIWSSQAAVAGEVLAEAYLSASDVAAIGITNQRETAIVWDRRTAGMCNRLREAGLADLIRARNRRVPLPSRLVPWSEDSREATQDAQPRQASLPRPPIDYQDGTLQSPQESGECLGDDVIKGLQV